MVYIAILLAVVGIAMLISYLNTLSFLKHGAECKATVTDTESETHYETRKSDSGTRRSKKTYHRLIVEYTVNGVAYTGKLEVSESELANAVGSSVDIIYKEDKPEKITAGTLESNKGNLKTLMIATIVCFVAAVVLGVIALV